MTVAFPTDPAPSPADDAAVPATDDRTAVAWWEAAFKYCCIGVAILDGRRGRILLVNDSFAAMVGRHADDMPGTDPIGLVATDDRPRVRAELRRAQRGEGHEADTESRWLRPDGSVVWMLLSFDVVRSPVHGPPRILLHARDVSDRTRAEASLRASNDQLAEAQRLAKVGSFEWNVAGDKLVVSPELARIFGASNGLTAGDATWFLDRVHPDDRSGVIDAFDASLRGVPSSAEHRIVLADDEVRWVQTRSRAVTDRRSDTLRLVGTCQDVTAGRAARERLEHTALHDPLTGLANRALFNDRAVHAMERGGRLPRPLSVLYVDVDDFKQANDSYGHVAGDLLLKGAAARLQASVRPGDTVARLGGDEFAVLLEDSTEETARAVAERVLEQFRQPFRVSGSEVHVAVSIGIGVAASGDGVQDLLVAADTALYAAKGAGKDRYRVFEPRLRAAAHERSTLRNDLTAALERGEMEVFYQPIVEVASGAVAGLEALLRWRHPRRGLLLPAEFLSLAEASGLIVPVGRWVLREACGRTARWRSTHSPLRHLRVSVNMSGRQLQDPGLAEDVAAILDDTGLPAHALTLEVSEGVVADQDGMLDTVGRLNALGARVAIDDFGAFGSSLRFLRRFPPGELKLDRALVATLDGSPEAGAMVGAVIELGHALRLRAVAEGVERPGQLEQLAALGCDLAQGLHWIGPRPAPDVESWLTSLTNP